MNYVNPVEYSKKILALMEDEMPEVEEVVPVKGEKTMKERISELSEDEKTKLKQYMEAIKEIKQEIYELIASTDRKSTRLNSSHLKLSRMPSSA